MRHLILLLVAVLTAGLALAQDPADLDLEHSVNSQFVTPHTDWAVPYAQGQTRVLFFVNGHGTTPREVIELKQRFDFEAQMVFWATIIDTPNQHWHGDEAGLRRVARFLSQKWDAFVFMEAELEKLPSEHQYSLIKAVTEGAGLVFVGGNDSRVLKDKNRLTEVPAFLSDVAGAAPFAIKNGRGVRLPAPPKIEYAPGWEVVYDEWDMRLGKAILWAAGKEPKLALTLTPKAEALGRPMLPGPAATLAWDGASGKPVASLTLRRDDGAIVTLPSQPLKTASGSVEVQLPAARAGRYHLDVIARDGKNVVGFASAPLTVICQRKVEAVKLAPDWVEIGDRLSGTVALSGQPYANERLIVSLLDRRDREIARQVVKPTATEGAFSFAVQPWFPMLLEVRATIVDGNQEVASAWQFARVVKRNRGQFNFVMWDLPRGNLAPWGEESLARSGVTVQLSGAAPPAFVAAYDIAWIPYTIHIGKACEPACWADEAGVQGWVDGIVNKEWVTASRRHGVFVYSLGDEIVVRGSCTRPSCLTNYRRYLQQQYGTIAALNASWGTDFQSFEEVQLSQPDDNNEAEALRAGHFPRWYDRQAYQSYNFCQLTERFGQAFRALDPQSKCGFEGAGTFRDGDDLDGFVRSNGWWSPYPGTADEVLRSIAPRDFPHSNWMGYTRDADTLLEKYWRMVTRGCDSVFWWRWDGVGRFHGWLMENLDPYPANQEIIRDTRIVREGLGDLLLQSQMQTDGIGMLYSQPSAYAARVQTGPTFGSYENNHSAFHGALRDLGYNFHYFTDRQMRLGEVNLSRYKVIILPMTQAMSAQEAEMFRQYVRGGGVLIADVRPAIYDGHVKPLAAGQLDEVFGVKRMGFGEAQISDGQIGDLELPKLRVDTGIQAAGANAAGAAGQTPLGLVNRFGQGTAILLNLAMSTYPALGSASTSEAAATALQELLTRAAVAPALQLSDSKGARLRNVEVTRWINGPVQIVSIFRHQGQAETARLKLPQPMYAYDLKNRKDLGQQQVVSLTITPYRAMFFALSPQPLQPVALKVGPTVALGSVQRVTIASTSPQGQQGVKVTVKPPNGESADWANEVVVADKRGVTVDVPVALNDPTGKWTVMATDVYTGKTTSASFSVK